MVYNYEDDDQSYSPGNLPKDGLSYLKADEKCLTLRNIPTPQSENACRYAEFEALPFGFEVPEMRRELPFINSDGPIPAPALDLIEKPNVH